MSTDPIIIRALHTNVDETHVQSEHLDQRKDITDQTSKQVDEHQIIQAEDRVIGTVAGNVLLKYMRSAGLIQFSIALVCFAIAEACSVVLTIMFTSWSEHSENQADPSIYLRLCLVLGQIQNRIHSFFSFSFLLSIVHLSKSKHDG